MESRREKLSVLPSDQDILKFKIYGIIREDNQPYSTETMPEKLVLGLCSALRIFFLNIMIRSVISRKGSKVSLNETEAIGHPVCQNEREVCGRPEDHRWNFAFID